LSVKRSDTFKDRLFEGARQLGVHLTESNLAAFDLYRSELQKWGKIHNLAGNLSDHGILVLHFLDSLAFLQGLPRGANLRLADVGSGAGFPGLPIALARPDFQAALIEPRNKRALFLQNVIRRLDLKNVHVLNGRVEDFAPEDECFDVVVSRALWSVGECWNKARSLLCAKGRFVAGKGRMYEKELEDLSFKPRIKSLKLPFDHVDRWLIILISEECSTGNT